MPLTESYVKSDGHVPGGVTLGEYLQRTAKRFPDRTALIFRDRVFTWRELAESVDRFALGLLDLGVEKGDRVGILFPNHPEFVIAYLATARIGAIHIPISVLFREKEITFISNHADVKALVAIGAFRDADFASILKDIRPRLPEQTRVIVSGGAHPGQIPFERLLEQDLSEKFGPDHLDAAYLPASGLVASDPVEIIYTSGTTGDPKGCLHTHDTTCRSSLATIHLGGITEKDSWLMMCPMTHQLGLVLGNYTAVISGSSTTLLEMWNAPKALDEIERMRPTILIGVPTMLVDMLAQPDFKERDVTSVRLIYTAGAACPIEIARRVTASFGCTLVSAYGMSESNYMTITRLDDPLEIVTETVGRPQYGGVEIKIVDDDGRIVPTGARGEICGRGHDVCDGYYRNPELTAATFDADGWVRSGDLGVMDELGNTRIVGRIKELIIRGGENIAPREIEEYLFENPRVLNCAVVGMPDPKLGERICAFIIPKDANDKIDRDEIKAFLAGKVAKFKIPDRVEVVAEFPLTPSGKVLKYKLRERIESILEKGF